MTETCKPANRKGERNVFCPLYRECLDHASKNHWEYWACHDCEHSQKAESLSALLLSSSQNDDLCYTLSPSIYLKTKSFSI